MLNIFAIIILCGICNAKSDESDESIDSLYDDYKIVTELTSKDFETLVINASHTKVWIILFYSPLCLHSQALVPEFVKAAYVMRNEVKFGAVNVNKYKSFLDEYDVPGVPFIKIFGRDRTQPWNYKGRWKAKEIIRASWSAEFNNCFYRT